MTGGHLGGVLPYPLSGQHSWPSWLLALWMRVLWVQRTFKKMKSYQSQTTTCLKRKLEILAMDIWAPETHLRIQEEDNLLKANHIGEEDKTRSEGS